MGNFETTIREIKDHIKDVYINENKPFIVGFSGGKDSSLTLQLTWEAVRELDKKELQNDIYVISVDTLVDTPYIKYYIEHTLNKINEYAKVHNLPIIAKLLYPALEDTFWVNLIGKGYPAPSQTFRWCTDRLKIFPVNKFVNEQVAKSGEVVILLGARKSESISRGQVFKNREEEKKKSKLGLSLHKSLEGAYIFTPIEDLSTNEVWQYLFEHENTPWGLSNKVLSGMYKNAAGGECPMVIDTSTPSCGESRFGCWVCTLVSTDLSMENIVDSGEEWMKPLVDFRNLLKKTINPELKEGYRKSKRRNGRVQFTNEGKVVYGPYKIEWKKKFLEILLEAECDILEQIEEQDFRLITKDELLMIRSIWKTEDADWEDSLLQIYEKVKGEKLQLEDDDGVRLSIDDKSLLSEICARNNFPDGLIAKLIDIERQSSGLARRVGIMNKIISVFNEEWRTLDEIKLSKGIENEN